MKKKALLFIIGGCLATTFAIAFEAGKTAFTKLGTTTLREEPGASAKSVGTVAFATSVKINELQGHWAKVSSGDSSGWVYLGNLSEEKPVENHSVEGLPTAASPTTTSLASRGLEDAAKQYAAEPGNVAPAADVEWMKANSDAIDAAKVAEYMKANKKGEYQ